MTDLGWEQSQLCAQEVPIKSEATTFGLWGSKETLKHPLGLHLTEGPKGLYSNPTK